MARSRRTGLLVLPLLLAIGAVGHLVLGGGGQGGPRAEGDPEDAAEAITPDALGAGAGPDGILAAGGGWAGPKKVAAAKEEPDAP